MAHDNFSKSQQTNFNNSQLFRKNMFHINKAELFANPKSRTLNVLKTMRSCLDNNYYFVNDLLIIMNIKREILMSLNHNVKMNSA